MKLTINRFASGEYGRRWYHRFSWLDRAFDRAPSLKKKLSWRASELVIANQLNQ